MTETVTFRFARADWIALSTAVARQPLILRIAMVGVTLSGLAVVASFLDAGDGSGRTLLAAVLGGGGRWLPWYLFAALLALGLFFRHRLVGFTAAMNFARMPLADRDLTVELGDEEVRAATADGGFDWRFPWTAVHRLVETPTHLVLAAGPRQGLPIPRAAFADADAFLRARDFVRAHLSEGASHEHS